MGIGTSIFLIAVGAILKFAVTASVSGVSLQTVGNNLIVAKTLSGLASAVTVRIDSAAIPGVVGTIAGDDTIFIAVSDQDTQITAVDMINGVFS